jgi:hypothetical protein
MKTQGISSQRSVVILTATRTSISHTVMVALLEVTTRSSGKNKFVYFPYVSHLFEVPEPKLMELNLSELTLT